MPGTNPGHDECVEDLDRILREQPRYHRRIQISAYAHDDIVPEIANPAIMVVEAKAVSGNRFGTQFHDRNIAMDNQIVDVQLRAMRQHLAEFREGAGDEIGL